MLTFTKHCTLAGVGARLRSGWLLLLILAFSFSSVIAQEQTITGTVTSAEDGGPLPGVNVILKGTTTGTVTNIEGEYRLTVPSDAETLLFSFIGLKQQEVAINGRSTVSVQMVEDARQLSEVVITGQGTGISKNRLATTVDVVDAEDIKFQPVTRIDQILQSALPNTQFQLSSGDPGTASIVRSRGISSALLSTTPIIYVDGVRVDNLNNQSALNIGTGGAQSTALADIPVESIERIEFVKGGAATTLYGADAGNGVIQIFTKDGTPGEAKFSFETQQGAIVGTGDYFKYDETAEIAFRPGHLQSYRMGVSGGNEKTTYNFSGNIYGDNSFREGIENQRYSTRLSLKSQLNDKLNYRGSFGFVNNNFTRLPNANTSFDRAYGIEQGLSTIDIGLSTIDPSEFTPEDIEAVRQLVSDVARTADISETVNRFQTSSSLIYNPIEKITINGTFGIDSRVSKQQDISTNEYLVIQQSVPAGTTDQGSIGVVDRNFFSTTASLTAQYEEEVGDFSFVTVAGGQFFRNDDRQVRLDATEVVEGSRSVNNSAEVVGEDFIQTVTNYGYFAKENVGFKDRYFADFGFRIDYNTAFGTDIGGQFFPSVGASYVVSNEPFFEGITGVVSYLKLRGTYGEAGNFPPPFSRDANLLVNPYAGGTAIQLSVPPAPTLVPERVQTLEFGMDARFIDDRISLGVTYFDSRTVDALFTAPFAPSVGLNSRVRNLGEISNKGFEITSSFNVIRSSNWDLTFNASANIIENEVISSGGAAEFNIGGFTFLGPFVKEGLPVGYLRGAQPTFAEDGSVSDVERNANLGTPLPSLYGSLSLNLTFKQRLTLFVNGDYQSGGSAVNVNEVLRFFRGLDDDRIPEAAASTSFFDLGGVWVESSDYLKIRNISLAYNFPDRYFGGIAKNVSLSFTALNPLNFFAATNFDPETTGSGASTAAASTRGQNRINVGAFGYGAFSQPRQFIGTLKFNF